VVDLRLHLACGKAIRAGELRPSRGAKGILLSVGQGLRGLLCAALPRLSIEEVQRPVEAVLDGANGRGNAQSDAGPAARD
jgi:hypothetical protein